MKGKITLITGQVNMNFELLGVNCTLFFIISTVALLSIRPGYHEMGIQASMLQPNSVCLSLSLVPPLTQNLVSQSFQAVDTMSQQIAVHETQVFFLSHSVESFLTWV